MGGGFKRYGLYHKTQGVPDDWALDDRPGKKQIFGLVCAHRSKGRNFAFFEVVSCPDIGNTLCFVVQTIPLKPPYRRRYVEGVHEPDRKFASGVELPCQSVLMAQAKLGQRILVLVSSPVVAGAYVGAVHHNFCTANVRYP